MTKSEKLLSMLCEGVTIKFDKISYADMKEIEKIVTDRKVRISSPKIDKEKYTVTLVNDADAKQVISVLKNKFKKLVSKRIENNKFKVTLY